MDPGAIAVAAIIAFALALWAPWRPASPEVSLQISGDLGADVGLMARAPGNSALALSPDGTILAGIRRHERWSLSDLHSATGPTPGLAARGDVRRAISVFPPDG